jgi:hypothetical protein
LLLEIQLTQDEDDRRILDVTQFSAKAAYLSLHDDHCNDSTTRLWTPGCQAMPKFFDGCYTLTG